MGKLDSKYYRTLIRQYNQLKAIPAAKRTAWQAQQLRRLKRSIDEYELRAALAEVQG